MLSRHKFCCYMCLPNALLLHECGLHILPTIIFITLEYIDYFLSENLGFESRGSHDFFIIIFFYIYFFGHYYYSANLQIQHYCLYSDSPTLLPLMMHRPPAPSAL